MTEAVFLFDQSGNLGRHFKASPLEELRSKRQIREAFVKHPREAVWIASSGSFIRDLVSVESGHGDRRVLALEPVESARQEQLRAFFRVVITLNPGIKLLPADELAEVIQSPDRQDLFIGGTVNVQDGTVVLFRGSLDPLVIPLSWFGAEGDFEVIDFGHGVRVGSVEAATDAILYEFDAQARRRAKKRSHRTRPKLWWRSEAVENSAQAFPK